jgi:hypothetical protein
MFNAADQYTQRNAPGQKLGKNAPLEMAPIRPQRGTTSRASTVGNTGETNAPRQFGKMPLPVMQA